MFQASLLSDSDDFDGANHGSGFGYMSKGEQRRDGRIPLDVRR